jgi:ribosomal protein S3
MGQKVHPLGFRVGITKKHQSQWFARFQKYAYAQSVVEDHMLRKTLLNLFNNLQPEVATSNNAKQAKKAKITQIKIERGLIPYEIGIQVHTDDCLSLTKAIDNLKINKDLVSNLQKTRQYLLKTATQLKTNVSNMVVGEEEQQNATVELPKGKKRKSTDFMRRFTSLDKKRTKKTSKMKGRRKFGNKFKKSFKGKTVKRKKLSKTIFMRLKAVKKRLKKRQNLKKRYGVLISRGLFMRKKGTVITRKVFIKKYAKKAKFKNKKEFLSKQSSQSRLGIKLTKITKRTSFTNRMYKKFANLFLTKLNKQFLLHLKTIMTRLRQAQTTAYAPLGYNHKWYSTKALYKATDLKMHKLTKLIKILEKKSLIKMESLRKDYITFGSLSPTRVIGYYQIITYLKQLKELVIKMSKRSKLDRTKTPLNKSANTSNRIKGDIFFKDKILSLIRAKSKQKKYITEKLIKNVQTLADNNQTLTHECRKVKLLSYLKDVVTKHRTENIYYYLATIADARKDLKNLKLYIKQHANFLFGINTLADPNVLLQKVTKVLSTAGSSAGRTSLGDIHTGSQDSLQQVFLNFINDQRQMFKANLALTPKISIKFFSVKTTDFVEKASVVADTIVDALEKRKAFRGVIKKAKEDLMRRPRVKGVKIQVAGRLNGAEIARSEWVRAGRVPLQTLRANIDYSYGTASTIYGIIGVKVWIFKGYTKIN